RDGGTSYRAPAKTQQIAAPHSSQWFHVTVPPPFSPRKDALGSERFRPAGRARIYAEASADGAPAIRECRWSRRCREECPDQSAGGPWAQVSCCPSSLRFRAELATNPMAGVSSPLAPRKIGRASCRERVCMRLV